MRAPESLLKKLLAEPLAIVLLEPRQIEAILVELLLARGVIDAAREHPERASDDELTVLLRQYDAIWGIIFADERFRDWMVRAIGPDTKLETPEDDPEGTGGRA